MRPVTIVLFDSLRNRTSVSFVFTVKPFAQSKTKPSVKKRSSTVEFKLLLIVVDSERVDPVLEAVLEAGATGATLLSSARGVGLSKRTTFLGLELFQRRNILLILVDATRADHVLQVAEIAGQLDETLGTGIALQLPVEKALGLTEHIRRLAQEHPE